MSDTWDHYIRQFCELWPPGTFFSFRFNVEPLLAVILVSIVCGAVGALVVGNRMAFFSDALAHSAFAGVGLGLLIGLVSGTDLDSFLPWLTAIMVVFGILVGLGIAFVREKSGQAYDTVIGVFFAGAMGLGAIMLKVASSRRYLPSEDFLFGQIVNVQFEDLLVLAVLLALTAAVLFWRYNDMVFTSFSPTLARSRQVPVRLCTYLFIALLAVIINICLKATGALLINALLVVPAATAANLCRNMRQMFRWSILLCLAAGVLGQFLAWEVSIASQRLTGAHLNLPQSGVTVVLGVLFFFLSLLAGPVRRRWARRHQGGAALHKS